jgi:hypothetical protein
MLFPLGAAEFKHVVVDVEGQRNVEVVGADGRVGPLGFSGLEVKEADLVPEEGADVALEGGEAIC